jgi:hypothetical protein
LGAAEPIIKAAASGPEQEEEPKFGKEKYSEKKSKEDERKLRRHSRIRRTVCERKESHSARKQRLDLA